jgi:hypothetical protein
MSRRGRIGLMSMQPETTLDPQFSTRDVKPTPWWQSTDGIAACWSLSHPGVVGGIGVHGRAAVIDGFGAQLVVPAFVAVDLA